MVNLAPTKLQARVSTEHYHAGNLLPGTNADFYNMRATTTRRFNVGMAADGVVDCGIALNHDLSSGGAGVDLLVQVVALINLSAVGKSSNSVATTLWSTYAGSIYMKSGARWWMLPEASAGIPTDALRQIEIPELRAPIDALQVYVVPQATPDAGSFNLRVVRRY